MLIVHVPIPRSDLLALESLLAAADVFCTTFRDYGEAQYQVATYLRENTEFETTVYMLVDRNILSRIAGLATGCTLTEQHKLAAAILAIAQCADILIEPNIALYELADTEGSLSASSELKMFRYMDSQHPQVLTDIALGRSQRIPFGKLGNIDKEYPEKYDFERPLKTWKANYTVALKIATLELGADSAESKMLSLMRWMFEDFLFSGPALCLANRYLAPSGPRKRLFKGLRSPHRQRALQGVRNAAWDLALISEWCRKLDQQNEGKVLWLFATFDKGLKEIARIFLSPSSTNFPIEWYLQQEFQKLWGIDSGTRLFYQYQEYQHRITDPGRALVQGLSSERAKRFLQELEDVIFDYEI